MKILYVECRTCNGSGRIDPLKYCRKCDGCGFIKTEFCLEEINGLKVIYNCQDSNTERPSPIET